MNMRKFFGIAIVFIVLAVLARRRYLALTKKAGVANGHHCPDRLDTGNTEPGDKQ